MNEPPIYNNFRKWFLEKEHPHSKLNKTVFIHDILKFTGFILVFLIIYNNVEKLNQINFAFIKIGSVTLLVILFFILRKAWHLCINLKYWFKGFNHGTKMLIGIGLIFLLFIFFFNQEKAVSSIAEKYNSVSFSNFNPVKFGNFSLSLLNSNKTISSNSSNFYPSSSTIRLVPSEMEEYKLFKDIYKSCAYLEVLGESQGIYDLKQKSCREACGKRGLDYSSNICEKDKLVCYCKK